jgi:AbrB family looped-hinge helix DNA binding protein
MKSVIGERGQVTIPKPLRERLGLRPGEQVEFEEKRGAIIVRKAAAEKSPIDRLVGVISQRVDVDAYLEETRGPRWNPELDGEEPA